MNDQQLERLSYKKLIIPGVVGKLCFAVLLCLTYAPIPAELVELFDTNIRYSAMALPYNVSNAVFGGTAPLAATYLISITNNLLSPSFYLIFAASVMLFCLVFLKESYMKVL